MAAVVERATSRRAGSGFGRIGRPVATLFAGLILLGGTAYAVTPIRDALESFAGYFAGDDSVDQPGRALEPGDDAPRWLTGGERRGQRLIAEQQGFGLYVVRQESGSIGFALGDNLGISDSPAGWAEQFADHAVVLLGPGAGSLTPEGRLPVYGVSAATVAAVELTYADGPPTRVDGLDGGFVVMADVGREPQDIIGLGSEGAELERVSIADYEWHFIADQSCRVDAICPDGAYRPRE